MHTPSPLHTKSSLPAAAHRASFTSSLVDLLVSLRPRQWAKNTLVFLALVFSVNQYWTPTDISVTGQLAWKVLFAFLFFCMVSGAEYLVNDLLDASNDRAHPVKRHRPIAAGRVSPALALGSAGLLAASGLAGSFMLAPLFGLVVGSYLLLMGAYSLALKHLVIVDIFVIALGFVLRAVSGAVVIDVPVSPWLYMCTILGALFLGFAKRRQEIVLLQGQAPDHRRVLEEYTPALLDQLIGVVASSTVVAYSFYTFSADSLPRNHAMMLTIPFVLYGVFRYLYLVYKKNQGGSPEEVLFTDTPLLLNIVLWLAVSASVLIAFRGA